MKYGLKVEAEKIAGQERVFTPEALEFILDLEDHFGHRRRELMEDRVKRQAELDKTGKLDFPHETANMRAAAWSVREIPDDLLDRRVEITGPVDRKMIINALNSGANVFMADFEDSSTPTWANVINGQINLMDANTRRINYIDPVTHKEYKLNDKTAVLMVRPRGLHMEEKHLLLEGEPLSASFFDFGLYLFHNRKKPYFYLPKMESYHEAQLWSEVITHAEDALKLPRGTVRVTALIETVTAAFQMDEILSVLREHIVGLNCGRWDYIFNFIKRFSAHKSFVLPDRDTVTMQSHFLRSYSQLLIKTCHRRKAFAMGGMAAQIPIKNDEAANKAAMEKVGADKKREAEDGHDGTWVAHPGLVAVARTIFDKYMPMANQLDKLREDVKAAAQDLLTVPKGDVTEAGVRKNINVGILYLRAWLGGNGCVPLYNLMEDAATAEISRTQLWQWRHHKVMMKDGRALDDALMHDLMKQETMKLTGELGRDRHLHDASLLFRDMVMAGKLDEFLTTKAYDMVLAYEKEPANKAKQA
ncbi:MAG: malate synthase A [Alphaproteobacteria bacterium]|nr:malate synthase A [Alphaproteobacteria bacterium]